MSAPTDTLATCQVVLAQPPRRGRQGFDYAVAISAATVGARGLHMQKLTIPPATRARAHTHLGHETALYALSGVSGCLYGAALNQRLTLGEGAFCYIPPGVPHLPFNPSATEAAVVLIARTDPNDQESLVLLPDLDVIGARILANDASLPPLRLAGPGSDPAVQVIDNAADYTAVLARIAALMDAVPGTPEGAELDRLADLITRYEASH